MNILEIFFQDSKYLHDSVYSFETGEKDTKKRKKEKKRKMVGVLRVSHVNVRSVFGLLE